MGKPKFNPESDIPSLSGKVIIVTGTTSKRKAMLTRSNIALKAAHLALVERQYCRSPAMIRHISTSLEGLSLRQTK